MTSPDAPNMPANPLTSLTPRLTSLSHGCGSKIAPVVMSEILKNSSNLPPELRAGIETAADAAVYRLNDEQALTATTDFFMPISDVYAMGGTPIMARGIVGMPINVLPLETHRRDFARWPGRGLHAARQRLRNRLSRIQVDNKSAW
jgi:selenide,water dikinase